MLLKSTPEDFRVVEQLSPKFLGEGPHWVYRVAKRKLTTLEAIGFIAKEARVEKSAISFAGLKDRQGATVQYVSIEGGNPIEIDTPDLKVSVAGRAAEPVSSRHVEGNLFEIVVRAVSFEEMNVLRDNLNEVRRFGLPNYFDDQRFGCVRHGQGFIVRDMIRGDVEGGLKKLICAASSFDNPEEANFKARLRDAWGDWGHCAGITKRGKHESLFQHLEKHPKDFIGAFFFISSRVRLIHLYAYQSFLWNKCVSVFLKEKLGNAPAGKIATDIGPLLSQKSLDSSLSAELLKDTFPLLDSSTKVKDPAKQRAIESVMKLENLKVSELRVEGIPGFVFKGEERALMLQPAYIRVKPPVPDDKFKGRSKMEFRFSLPNGSYATLVLKRLFLLPEGTRAVERERVHRPRKRFEARRMNRDGEKRKD